MQKQVKQTSRTTDVNQIAHQLVARSTQEPQPALPSIPSSISEYMAEIGRKGGQIGGKRRLKTMTSAERKKAAQRAAKARWKKPRP
jgi:hypothetical protein